MFSTEKFNLKNAIINPVRVNKEMSDKKMPFRLKAGLIGKLSVKVSTYYIFLYFNLDFTFKPLLRECEHRVVGYNDNPGSSKRPNVKRRRLFR
jgi:hypothetical protein